MQFFLGIIIGHNNLHNYFDICENLIVFLKHGLPCFLKWSPCWLSNISNKKLKIVLREEKNDLYIELLDLKK